MHRVPYKRNYSVKYITEADPKDLFVAARRDGMRSPTFARSEGVVSAGFIPREVRDTYSQVMGKDEEKPQVVLPQKPKHARHGAAPWFAVMSGMVVAGATVMVLVLTAPESVLPTGSMAKAIRQAMTATVFFAK